ncbi:hypothetical protein DEU56DRAFT_934091 [Suillus clintonianus]|uniref:uncharacterized protein n=1 Tax=Suillus clintonianus TaxID=1904413 RepID=UPI001B878636|nr:uncharacterized protein DEU56DRAFT_934091 [Suillus clintonianus]KAG2113388.1 hypothetical protein DEU56DRAFT_934091 [Suillus clintonianus]
MYDLFSSGVESDISTGSYSPIPPSPSSLSLDKRKPIESQRACAATRALPHSARYTRTPFCIEALYSAHPPMSSHVLSRLSGSVEHADLPSTGSIGIGSRPIHCSHFGRPHNCWNLAANLTTVQHKVLVRGTRYVSKTAPRIQPSPVEIENTILVQLDKFITDVTVAGILGGRTSDERIPRAWIMLSPAQRWVDCMRPEADLAVTRVQQQHNVFRGGHQHSASDPSALRDAATS